MALTIIEFWGSPGSGKSTMAAEVFAEAAKTGLNAHYVPEFIKPQAIKGIPIEELDQPWIAGEQSHVESICYGKFDFIFVDSPVLLPAFFGHYYDEDDMGLASVMCRWENRAKAKYDIKRKRFFVPLVEEWFKQTGRYESYEQSKKMSETMFRWIKKVTGEDPIVVQDRDRQKFVRKYVLDLTETV